MDESDRRPASPVLADQVLWADEKPFTEFGQFGEGQLDLRVFEQDTWWVDIHGEPHLLEEMSTDYLRNVRLFLLEHAVMYQRRMTLRYAIEKVQEAWGEAPEGFSEYLARKSSPDTLDSESWLRQTPLFMRLEMLLADIDSEDA